MYRFPLALVLVSIAASVGFGTAHAARFGSFKTPSGNIVCGYGDVSSARNASIGCGIESGLRPAPKNTCHDLDYSGKRMSLRSTGAAVIDLCAGDPGPFLLADKAPVLRYGSSWRGATITCTSRRTGLTCTNRSGHGFFMSRTHSYRF
jgi:hypothetical protein